MKNYFKIIQSVSHPLRFVVSRLLMKSGLSPLIIVQRGNIRLRFYPTPTSAITWIDSSYERDEDDFIRRYLRTGDVVVDGGANIGLVSLLAASIVGKNGKVYAIEAHPRIFRYLAGNVKINEFTNIELFNVALGEREDTVIFSDETWDELNSVISPASRSKCIEIKSQPLDTLGISLPKVQLLKIDVEGYELPVFTGAETILEKTECVYFESNQQHFARFGYSCVDVFRVLLSHGFEIVRFVDRETLATIDQSYESFKNENLIGIRNRRSFLERTNYTVVTL